MVNDKIDLVVNKLNGKITEVQTNELKQMLLTAPEEKYEEVSAVKVKSTFITLILSSILGLFGAGSFYLGFFKRGIIKLIFNIIVPLTLGFVFLFWLSPLHKEYCSQTKNISAAINSNNEFNYSYESLKSTKSRYDSAFDTFYTNIGLINKQIDEYTPVNEFLTSEQFVSDLSAFEEELITFGNSTAVSNLADKVEEALLVLKELEIDEATDTEKEESDDTDETGEHKETLTDKVKFVSESIQYLAKTGYVSDLNGQLVETVEKVKSFTDAISVDCIKFENITEELNKLPLSYLNECDEKLFEILSKLNKVSVLGINNLISEINTLNTKIFELQKKEGINVVEKAEETPLGLAVKEFKEKYITNKDNNKDEKKKPFLELNLRSGDAKEEYTISQFVNDFSKQLNSLNTAGTEIKKLIYNEESGNNINQLNNEMLKQKNNFVKNNKDYFEYFSSGYVENLRNINKSVPEAKANTVENKTELVAATATVYSVIDSMERETEVNKIKSDIEKVKSELDALEGRAENCYDDWDFSYKYQDMFFLVFFITDGIIIFAYWLGEVFKEREMCHTLNFENIKKVIT